MKLDIENWLNGEGADFLYRVGIRPGNRVLDFGCGSGHYTIPAAQVVGKNGMVIAVDRDRDVLFSLKIAAGSKGLTNIHPEAASEEPAINLPDQSVDAILAYDILHYFESRQNLLEQFYRVLKSSGFLSVYPKHHKDDYPLFNLAHLSLKEIIAEIERAGFILKEKFREELIHDDNYNLGIVLNFTREKT